MALLGLAIGWFVAPGDVQGGLFSPDTAPGYGLEDELAELGRVREKIVRRHALRHALECEARALALEIEGLRARYERARATIRRDRRVIAEQERRLDRIVPRLVARERSLHERRSQAARALAEFATLSRQGGLDPRVRAHMRAISPALIDLLDASDAATASLERQRERAARTTDRLERRAPLLRAEAMELERERESKRARRRAALERVARLDVELDALAGENARLGRLVLVVRAAHVMRVAPQPDRPASQQERFTPTALQIGSVRGRAAEMAVVVGRVQAQHRSLAQVEVASVEPSLAPMARLPRVAPATPIAGLKGLAVAGGASVSAGRATLPPDARTFLAVLPVVGTPSRIAAGELPRPEPIRPSLDAVARRFDGRDKGGGVAIDAAPGQRVAAAEDGRVVFADAFKGYGLLLIIEHDNEYHTLLWGFSRLRVDSGDEVHGGQIVGVMDVVDGALPQLHVELRRNGRPVNPLPWLASSSSKVRG